MSPSIAHEQRAWANEDSISFFSSNRNRVEELYPSERVFLPRALAEAQTVLDVGCACGGFAPIMRTLNPRIRYTGVDVVPAMLSEAQSRHPAHEFVLAAGHALPFADRSFDLVHCSGVVHLNSAYEAMIAEMWRVSSQSLLFDMRLTEGQSRIGTFNVDFGKAGPPDGLLPYNLVNFAAARALIDGLPAPPAQVEVFGYPHPASHNSSFGPDHEVIMAFVLMSRTGERPGWHADIAERAKTNATSSAAVPDSRET